ncbi:hypothetical protein DAERI_010050 [Deinococcus aerius]|uniref:Uncharacterized protein n=1 Tax=Deinococcus aerius TaxID=200253 RepID=A0A2I9DD82_9DEIO|nr:hypothetical protein [Deinococcus aerius]GBF03878.1 hypothetical protein DAERI_010050 [Deinococcus aerius]
MTPRPPTILLILPRREAGPRPFILRGLRRAMRELTGDARVYALRSRGDRRRCTCLVRGTWPVPPARVHRVLVEAFCVLATLEGSYDR